MTTMVRRKSNSRPRAKRQDAVAAGSPAMSTPPPDPGSWEYMFRMLTVFLRTHGHCEVPYTPRRDSLGYWVMQQRMAYLAGTLPPPLHERLVALHMQFDTHDPSETARERRWNEKFDALQAFKKQEGHCRLPCGPGNFFRLYQWLAMQRRLHVTEKLRRDRRDRLLAIGVELERAKRGQTASRGPGINQEKWDQRFQELAAFKARFGHCSVPVRWPENPALANWVNNQRELMSAGRIDAGRRELLTKLGVVPYGGQRRVSWTSRYEALLAFKRAHGHCRVPEGWSEDPALAYWVNTQRARFAKGRMNLERQRLLEAAGFVLRSGHSHREVSERWEENFARLVELKQQEGDCHAALVNSSDRALQLWARAQRDNYRQGTLSAERRERLESIGFDWSAYDAMWDRKFGQLLQFKKEHGHCSISGTYNGIHGLGSWVAQQRDYKRRGILSSERIRRLEEVGFPWQRENPQRQKQIATLIEFKRRFGHFDVPTRWPENPALAIWVAIQRKLHAEGRLPARRQAQLEAIGFNWRRTRTSTAQFDARWEEMFAALAAFKQEQGHCNAAFSHTPTASTATGKKLLHWAQTQRTLRRQGELREDRQRRLDELGFLWAPLDDAWEGHYAALVEFHRRNGHCRVPKKVAETRTLAGWLMWQRKYLQLGRLPKDKAERLRTIGIEAADPNRLWEMQYTRLLEFHREHGHCVVPAGNERLRNLFKWARHQPRLRAAGSLSPAQMERLDALGFDWRERRTRSWDENFARLREFKERHGHCLITKSQAPDLQKWVCMQRAKYAAGQLSPDKRTRLDSVGLGGPLRVTRSWNENFARLRELKERRGDCHVTKREDSALQSWVRHQRQKYIAGQLSTEKRARLDSLGLNWEAMPGTTSPDARHQTPQHTPPEVSP